MSERRVTALFRRENGKKSPAFRFICRDENLERSEKLIISADVTESMAQTEGLFGSQSKVVMPHLSHATIY